LDFKLPISPHSGVEEEGSRKADARWLSSETPSDSEVWSLAKVNPRVHEAEKIDMIGRLEVNVEQRHGPYTSSYGCMSVTTSRN
jgi:hypothetical protein